jgi:resuscitation-promoting factor RpfB
LLRSLKYGIYAAVLAGVVGGTAAWRSVDKSVTLVVDGQPRAVQTLGGHVSDVLASAGYRLGVHDLVAPAPAATVHNGSRIVLNRARLLRLDVNGVHREIWTTASTVAQALDQLGYSSADFTSVSRAQRLPLTPTDLALRTPKFVTVVHDKKTVQVVTTDGTVGQLLADLSVPVSGQDQVSVPLGSALVPGQHILIGRVVRSMVTADQVLPFSTTNKSVSTVATGQTTILAAGQTGLAKVTYAVVSVDGKVVGRTPVKTVVVRAAQAQVVGVGSGPVASAAPVAGIAVTPGSAQAIARQLAAERGWGDDQFSCLVQMWDRESGWRVHAANPSGAYGIPQALPGYKMSSAGPDWQDNATTQITWGLGYIAGRYGTPCGAWSWWQAHDWY